MRRGKSCRQGEPSGSGTEMDTSSRPSSLLSNMLVLHIESGKRPGGDNLRIISGRLADQLVAARTDSTYYNEAIRALETNNGDAYAFVTLRSCIFRSRTDDPRRAVKRVRRRLLSSCLMSLSMCNDMRFQLSHLPKCPCSCCWHAPLLREPPPNPHQLHAPGPP